MVNSDVKLLAVLDKVEKKFASLSLERGERGLKGDRGDIGPKGEKGATGTTGAVGATGAAGPSGAKGDTGPKGDKGISIEQVRLDFDNHLVITLSDGSEIDAGEINVSGGTSLQSVHMGGAGAITAPLPSITTITTDYTTLHAPLEEVIKCTNTAALTVTMHPAPTQGQRRTIKRLGTGDVTIIGPIDGETQITLGDDVSVQLIYITDEWIII